jgi:arylsulfatase A-like enzyme
MTQKRPNILMIYPDQLRADAMGCAGNPVVKTPFFDRLANEGMRFTNAYTHYPLCCPFRASVLTGKYAHQTGMYANHFPIPANQTFLAPLLKQQGYDTAFFGKWHLDGGTNPGFVPPGERRLGFDHFVGFNRGHFYTKAIYYRDTDQPYHCPRWEPDFQADHLIDYLDEREDKEKPFFAYLCIGAPHYPNTMPKHLHDLYNPKDVNLPPGVPDPELQISTQRMKLSVDCAGDEAALDKSKAGESKKGPFDTESEEEIRDFMAKYYGMVTGVDYNIGRILNYLDKSGLAENTLVVMFSDHGDMLGQHGSFCGMKRSYYSASMHVPFIARLPGRIPAGTTNDGLIDVAVDTMPTLLELCGVDIPSEVAGVSQLSALEGKSETVRDAVQYQIIKQLSCKGGGGGYLPVPERGIRTKKWLYVRKQHLRIALFDLENDPGELNNLVEDQSYAPVMEQLDQLIKKHMQETGDDWDLEANWPPPNLISKTEAKRIIETELLVNAVIEP